MKKLGFVMLAGLGGTAHANGFLLNEFDAKSVGRGNASTATDVDPSSIYYNIGGLAAGDGTAFQIGGALIAPDSSYSDAAGGMKTSTNTDPQVIPHLFVSSRITSMFAVGVGFYTPFGSAVSWPDNSPQTDLVHKISLRTYFITPSVGANLGSFVPGLTVGGGLDIVPATVELQQDVFFGTETGTAHLGGKGLGFGARLGVMYQPRSLPRFSFGAMWRSEVNEKLDGTGDFDAASPFRAQLPPDGPIHTTVKLPQSISGGVAVRPTDNLEVEANLVWTNWSEFNSLDIDVPATMGTGTMTISQPKNYENRTTIRLGAEYRLPLSHLALRAGYIYDPTPVPANRLGPDLPDANRNDVTAGGSIYFGNYDVNLGLLAVLPSDRTSTLTPSFSKYEISAFVASVTLGGRFGSK